MRPGMKVVTEASRVCMAHSTMGLRWRMAASLRARRSWKSGAASTMMSARGTRVSARSGVMLAGWPSRVMEGLRSRRRRRMESMRGWPRWSVVWRSWRLRSAGLRVPPWARMRRPTPAAASSRATRPPRPPTREMRTVAALSLRWPSSPTPGTHICHS